MPPEEWPLTADGTCSYTVQEILDWLAALRTARSADAQRIDIMARMYARLSGATAADLKQEAFARLLEGRRSIGREVPIDAGVIGVMRSIASEEGLHRRRFQADERVSPDAEVMFNQADPTPQDQALWRHYWPRMVTALEQEFADKPIVLGILRARLRELAGMAAEPSMPLKDNERRAAVKQLLRRLILFRETQIEPQLVRHGKDSKVKHRAAATPKNSGGGL